jgi:hypothetical protein
VIFSNFFQHYIFFGEMSVSLNVPVIRRISQGECIISLSPMFTYHKFSHFRTLMFRYLTVYFLIFHLTFLHTLVINSHVRDEVLAPLWIDRRRFFRIFFWLSEGLINVFLHKIGIIFLSPVFFTEAPVNRESQWWNWLRSFAVDNVFAE